MRLKKVVAREFLILISILIIVGIFYLILAAYNARIERENTSKKEDYENYSDSLLYSVKSLNELAEDYERIPSFYTTPKYLVIFYSREIPITKVERHDLNEYSFEYWVDTIQNNEEYKRGMFDNYIIHSYTDKISFDEWEQLVFRIEEIDSLKSINEIISVSNYLDKKQKALNAAKKTTEKTNIKNYIIVITILLVSLAYFLRFLIYGIRWSIKTLKE